jgi:hypothetical protein
MQIFKDNGNREISAAVAFGKLQIDNWGDDSENLRATLFVSVSRSLRAPESFDKKVHQLSPHLFSV